MKATMRTWAQTDTLGVVSTYSTRSWTSQWNTLIKVSSANMATKAVLNSSRKMVIARQVSMTAWLMRSFTRSISGSRSVPRNTCRARTA